AGLTMLKRSVAADQFGAADQTDLFEQPAPPSPWRYVTDDRKLQEAIKADDAVAYKLRIPSVPRVAVRARFLQDLAQDRFANVLGAAIDSGMNPNGYEGDGIVL